MKISDLEFFDMGDVIDIIIESQNDHAEYDLIATQEDIDKILG